MLEETPNPATDGEQRKSVQQRLIEYALEQLAHVYIHPIIDYHDETGLTFGVIVKLPFKRGRKGREERPVIISAKKVIVGTFKEDGLGAPISTEVTVIQPSFFGVSKATQDILLHVAKDLQDKVEIENLPRNDIYSSIQNQMLLGFFHPDSRVPILLTNWIIATYMFPMFRVFPNLVLIGPRESGKTTFCGMALKLVWNPTAPSSGLRAAPLYRTVDSAKPTLIIDATKIDIRYQEVADIFEVIEMGGTVARCEGDEHKPKWYGVHSPRLFAVRAGVPFADKAIEIVTVRNKDPAYTKRKDAMFYDKTLRELPGNILRSAIYNWQDVLKAYKELEQDEVLRGRRFELWRPFLAVCKVYAPQDYEQLMSLAHEDTERTEKGDLGTDVENAVIGVLLDQFTDDEKGTRTFSLNMITTWTQTVLGKETVRNYRRIKDALTVLGLHIKRYNTADGVKYQIDPVRLREVARERRIIQYTPPTENEVQCSQCHKNIAKNKTDKYTTEKDGTILCSDCQLTNQIKEEAKRARAMEEAKLNPPKTEAEKKLKIKDPLRKPDEGQTSLPN